MSRHISTRWYRAPELILLEKSYDTKIDLWAAGCILSEMIYCSKEYKKSVKSVSNRIMFKGQSCYPVSPSVKQMEGVDDFKHD